MRAGLARGMRPKIHADEFTNLGGVSLAVELGAVSVDHLDVTPPAAYARLAQSKTVGVVLPAVNFNLGSSHFADARGLIDAGAAIALSTDINPGSAPCPSMPLVMAIACSLPEAAAGRGNERLHDQRRPRHRHGRAGGVY